MPRRKINTSISAPEPLARPEEAHGGAGAQPIVLDDLPPEIPIAIREIEAIETYVADLLEQIFDDVAAGVGNPGK